MVADQFSGEKESFAVNMHLMLAATQGSLKEMQLDIDMLEILNDGGYAISLSSHKLDGKITLTKQTERLTTVFVTVRSTMRKDSVERAIIQMIKTELEKLPANAELQRGNLHNMRAKPDIQSRRLGWYRPGAKLNAHRASVKGWLKVKMLSGKMAYLKGTINK